MPSNNRSGQSLVELLVALIVLEVLGAAVLAAAFTVTRIDRRVGRGAETDRLRRQAYRAAETADSCILAATPDTAEITFPATTERPLLRLLYRCGP